MVRAGDRGAATVGEDLPRLGVIEREARERLAGEDAGDAPGVEPCLEAGVMRGLDDIAQRVAIVGEVGLGVAVDDVGAAVVDDILKIGADVAERARGEVADARFHDPARVYHGTRMSDKTRLNCPATR